MNRTLPWMNLLGVASLAVLCAFQWSANRSLHLGWNAVEAQKLELKAKVEEQEGQLKMHAAELEQFRNQLAASGKATQDLEGSRRQLEKKVAQLESEREQLKASVETWAEAVKVRDARIKADQEQVKKLAEELNASIRKFNDLAQTHGELVQKWNDQQARLAAMRTNAVDQNGARAK